VKVYVKSPARLHLGLIDVHGGLGRMFGGLGVGIDRPNVILTAYNSDAMIIRGKKTELTKVLVQRFLDFYDVKANVEVEVKQVIPEHKGLGSGTQMALAVATALAKLFSINASTEQLSSAMGRGQRTGIGTAVFAKGGFVVDGGKHVANRSPTSPRSPIILRRPFPEDWRFIVAVPDGGTGLANDAEINAFKKLFPTENENASKICRLIVMKLLPALVEHDIVSFGEALTEIQEAIGESFSSVQGGIYSSELVTMGVKFMHEHGARGAGQTSWGPAFFALVEERKAENLRARVQAFLNEHGGGKAFVAAPNNKGAHVRILRTPNKQHG